MKFQLKPIVALLALATLFVSCNDDDAAENLTGTFGDAELYFDNGIAGNDLSLGTSYTNSNGESIAIERLNYIVSNVVLIKEDGTEYAYPKADSYFIVNEAAQQLTMHLEAIPAGDYKKVRFGVGVDDAQYQLGQAAQTGLWADAVSNQLGTTWQQGYGFINMGGSFMAGNVQDDTAFTVYQNGSAHYTEVTLDLPTTARVRHNEEPSIHIKTDVNVLLDGTNKIKLADNITDDMVIVASGANLAALAANTQQMFTVDHVHNGAGHHEE